MLSLKDIREKIKPEQKFCLDIIWNHFVDNDEWISKDLLRRELRLSEKSEYFSHLESLSRNIVFERFQNNEYHLVLTHLGAYLTSYGSRLETNYINLIEFILERYDKNPQNKIINCQKIGQALEIEGRDLTELGVLNETISYPEERPIRNQGRSGMYKDNSWEIEIQPNIEDLFGRDISEFVRELAEHLYIQDVPEESEGKQDSIENMKLNIFIGHGNSPI